jgi:hypothetical protein
LSFCTFSWVGLLLHWHSNKVIYYIYIQHVPVTFPTVPAFKKIHRLPHLINGLNTYISVNASLKITFWKVNDLLFIC